MRWRDRWWTRVEHLVAVAAMGALLVPLLWSELRAFGLVPYWGPPGPLGAWLAVAVAATPFLRRFAIGPRAIDRSGLFRAVVVLAALVEWQMNPESWRLWQLERPIGELWVLVALLAAYGQRRATLTAALLLVAVSISMNASGVTAAVSNCDCMCQPLMWSKGYHEMSAEAVRCALVACGCGLWATIAARRARRFGEALTFSLVAACLGGLACSYLLFGDAALLAAFDAADRLRRLASIAEMGLAAEAAWLAGMGFFAVLAVAGMGFGSRGARGSRRTFGRLVPLLALTLAIGVLAQKHDRWDRMAVARVTPARVGRAPWLGPERWASASHLVVGTTGELRLSPPDPNRENPHATSDWTVVVADEATSALHVHAALRAALERDARGVALLVHAPYPCCSDVRVPAGIRSPGWAFLDPLGPRLAALPIEAMPAVPSDEVLECQLPRPTDEPLADWLARGPGCSALHLAEQRGATPPVELRAEPLELEPVESAASIDGLLVGMLGGLAAFFVLVLAEIRPFRRDVTPRPTKGARRPILPTWLNASEATHTWGERGRWGYRSRPTSLFRGPASQSEAFRALGRRVLTVLGFLVRGAIGVTVTLVVGAATVILLAWIS